jgi:O-antigen ligase
MMILVKAWFNQRLVSSKDNKGIVILLLVLFALIPFQRRFHGIIDSFSRKLTLPEFSLPEYFSTKVHLYVADLLILILCLTVLLRFKTSLRDFFWAGPSKYLTLLFFAALTSLIFSITRSYSLQYLLLIQFSMVFLLFNCIRCAQRKIDFLPLIKAFAWIILALSCVECLIAFSQYLQQASIGLRFLGEPNISHFPFANPGKHRWIFDQLFPSQPSVDYLYRASGTFSHPNILGGFVFCSLMASYYLFMSEKNKIRRSFVLGMLPLQIFTLYIAYSRSALLALAFSTLFWCFLQYKKIVAERQLDFKKIITLLTAIVILGSAGIGVFYSQLSARGGILNYNSVTQYADTERLEYTKIALKMIREHPLVGVGFNNFQLYLDQFQSPHTPHVLFAKVHNIYLLMASETGLIGGGLFLLFLWFVVKTAYRAIFPIDKTKCSQEILFLFAAFLGLLLIGCFDFYFLNTQTGRMLLFGFAALLYAVSKQEIAKKPQADYNSFKCLRLKE